MERSVSEQKEREAEAEMSDDPFASSDEEDANNEIQQLLTKTTKPIIIKPASKQTIIDWVESAWNKIDDQPAMVAKSFAVTGISQCLDGSEDDNITNSIQPLNVLWLTVR